MAGHYTALQTVWSEAIPPSAVVGFVSSQILSVLAALSILREYRRRAPTVVTRLCHVGQKDDNITLTQANSPSPDVVEITSGSHSPDAKKRKMGKGASVLLSAISPRMKRKWW